jgi:hypothetical protein
MDTDNIADNFFGLLYVHLAVGICMYLVQIKTAIPELITSTVCQSLSSRNNLHIHK